MHHGSEREVLVLFALPPQHGEVAGLVGVDEVHGLLLLLELASLPCIATFVFALDVVAPFELLGDALAIGSSSGTRRGLVGVQPRQESGIAETLIESDTIALVEKVLEASDGEVVHGVELGVFLGPGIKGVDAEIERESL